MRRLLLCMGDIGSLSGDDPTARVEDFLETLAAYLAEETRIGVIFAGRIGTTAESLVRKLQLRLGQTRISSKVQTYLPRRPTEAELPEGSYVTYGAVVHAGEFPEQRREAMVRDADAVLLLGTGRGISEVHKLAKQECRFIIPVPIAAGSAVDEYAQQIRRHTASRSAIHEQLSRLGSAQLSGHEIAQATIDILDMFSKGHIGNSQVFLAMPFIKEFKDRAAAESAAREICQSLALRLYVAKDTTGDKPLIAEILENIEASAAVIAYLDLGRPNVYLEAGYAWGKGKPVLLCLKQGEPSAFDVNAHEQIRWSDIGDLKRRIRRRLEILISERRIITSG